MKNYLLVILFLGVLSTSCNKKDDDPVVEEEKNEEEVVEEEQVVLENEVNDFVYSALNSWYLWQDEVIELADDNFVDDQAYISYLNEFATPRGLFQSLRSPKDRFSVLVDDYDILFNAFAGVYKTNGVEYVLTRPPEGGNKVVGVVRYVINDSDADLKNVKRGDIFYGVNGTQLFAETDADGYITTSNLDLLNPDVFTMNFADLTDEGVAPNGVNIELTKAELTENPILISKTLEINGTKIGYVMYNSFTSNFDAELNTAFEKLKSDGVTELVLDLRYNLGGSVQSATRLASMITGQYTDELFAREQWNSKWQDYFGSDNIFVDKIDNNTPINSLNLNSVYVIATDDSASASELIINSLRPYIEVVHIGDVTRGKVEFSVTLVDNPEQEYTQTGFAPLPIPYIVLGGEFTTVEDANTNHKYALQPLVGTNVNADGFGDFTSGLTPDFPLLESLGNLGQLGEQGEPLLDLAIEKITGVTGKSLQKEVPENLQINTISSSNRRKPFREISIYDIRK